MIEARTPDPAGPAPDYCCAILAQGDAVLLERRPAHKRHAPGRLTCFGGRREPGEAPDACLARELAEELGFVPSFTGPELALHVDGRLIAWFYAARLSGAAPPPRLEPDVELVRLPVERLDHPDLSSWHAAILRAWTRRDTR